MRSDGGEQQSFGVEAWYGTRLDAARGHLFLPSEVTAELANCVDYLRRNPLPLVSLRPDEFELDATRRFAAALRGELDTGCGFALVDGLPVECWRRDDSVAAYWLLASCIARPVAQSHDGKLIYDVTDRGRPPGNGVRPDITNAQQNFHTDNSYNHVAPHYVALLCLHPARRGGVSGIVNFGWALAEMKRRHPDLVTRLFQPFYFDRQREHESGDMMVTHHPLFEIDDGRIVARLSRFQVMNGYRLAGEALDVAGEAALDAFEDIINDPEASKTFDFQPGQIQIINNRALGHRRTGFEDHDEPERRRHLVRLWLRDSGRRGYGG